MSITVTERNDIPCWHVVLQKNTAGKIIFYFLKNEPVKANVMANDVCIWRKKNEK